MKNTDIANVKELKAEMIRLSFVEDELLNALKPRFNSPSAVFVSAQTLFKKSPTTSKVLNDKGLLRPDILKLISRFAIPFVLNKTLFRRSGFLVKLLVDLVSQKAAGYVSETAVVKIIAQVKLLLNRIMPKKYAHSSTN